MDGVTKKGMFPKVTHCKSFQEFFFSKLELLLHNVFWKKIAE